MTYTTSIKDTSSKSFWEEPALCFSTVLIRSKIFLSFSMDIDQKFTGTTFVLSPNFRVTSEAVIFRIRLRINKNKKVRTEDDYVYHF